MSEIKKQGNKFAIPKGLGWAAVRLVVCRVGIFRRSRSQPGRDERCVPSDNKIRPRGPDVRRCKQVVCVVSLWGRGLRRWACGLWCVGAECVCGCVCVCVFAVGCRNLESLVCGCASCCDSYLAGGGFCRNLELLGTDGRDRQLIDFFCFWIFPRCLK